MVEGGKWWRIGAHLAYTWLLPWQDDDGRLRGDPLWLLVNIFPKEGFTEKEIVKILLSLQKVGLIHWYKIDGEGLFIQILKGEKGRRIKKNRYKSSIYPATCLTDDGQLSAECLPDVRPYGGLSLSPSPSPSPSKEKTLFLESVFLTDEEHKKLIERYGEELATAAIEELNNHKMSGGKKYKSDYHAILKWAIDAATKKKHKNKFGLQE
jgi:hypothetical protein